MYLLFDIAVVPELHNIFKRSKGIDQTTIVRTKGFIKATIVMAWIDYNLKTYERKGEYGYVLDALARKDFPVGIEESELNGTIKVYYILDTSLCEWLMSKYEGNINVNIKALKEYMDLWTQKALF